MSRGRAQTARAFRRQFFGKTGSIGPADRSPTAVMRRRVRTSIQSASPVRRLPRRRTIREARVVVLEVLKGLRTVAAVVAGLVVLAVGGAEEAWVVAEWAVG